MNTLIELTVPGMHCGGCARSIGRIIQGADAHAVVDTDVPRRQVCVRTSLPREEIVACLQAAGYPVAD